MQLQSLKQLVNKRRVAEALDDLLSIDSHWPFDTLNIILYARLVCPDASGKSLTHCEIGV